LGIRVTVPEEFVGASMGELSARRGYVTSIDVQSGDVSIRATLPASEYNALVEAIAAMTQRRGRIKREPPTESSK
jgi:elongation factor G